MGLSNDDGANKLVKSVRTLTTETETVCEKSADLNHLKRLSSVEVLPNSVAVDICKSPAEIHA